MMTSFKDGNVELECEKRGATITWFGPSLEYIENVDENIKIQLNKIMKFL